MMKQRSFTYESESSENASTETKRKERLNLLLALKSTVCGILSIGGSSPWVTFGGLPRLSTCMKDILNHGLRSREAETLEAATGRDYWPFVRGLRWLCPTLAPSLEAVYRQSRSNPDLQPSDVWLEESLLQLNLSDKIEILVENEHHLAHYYTEDAYLCNKECFSGMLFCLRAMEKNDPALLAEVNTFNRRRKNLMVRSSSLPIHPIQSPSTVTSITDHSETTTSFISQSPTGRRSSQDHLAPQFASPPKQESIEPPDVALIDQQCALAASNRSDRQSCPSTRQRHNSAAREALLSVLDSTDVPDEEATSSHDTDVQSNFSVDNHVFPLLLPNPPATSSSSSEPLHNMEVASRKVIDKKLDRRKSESQPTLTAKLDIGKNSELLDQILNDDTMRDDISVGSERPERKAVTKTQRDDISVASERPERKAVTKTHKRSHSDFVMMNGSHSGHDNMAAGMHRSESYCTSFPVQTQAARGPRRRSLMEDGGRCVTPLTECYFPRPHQGQSLRSFLTSQDFHTCADLDKENAHFNISEALIAAIEQMKWAQVIRPVNVTDEEGESDEEVQQLRQRIRIRKRERMSEKIMIAPVPFSSDGRTTGLRLIDAIVSRLYKEFQKSLLVTTSTSNSASPQLDNNMVWSGSSDSSDVDVEVDDTADNANLTSLQQSGLSLSLGSLYSEADIQKSNEDLNNLDYRQRAEGSTAESVAISLLRQFPEQQLPKASDIEWLVSEEDAPQALLPLPDSQPVSPDEADQHRMHGIGGPTRIRGNFEWAPPRAQIIFSIHPSPKLKQQIAKQNFRCAGCGTRVEPGYEKRFRYCDYLGKYFCQCCHINQMAAIPARILQKWDFNNYPVSNFSFELLQTMYDDPLFNVAALNPLLYRKVKMLEHMRDYRVQLFHIQTFLRTCRLADTSYTRLNNCPPHWIAEPDVYSLHDLIRAKNGELTSCLRELVTDAVCHISGCELCQARGFICELCGQNNDVVFPFELNRVITCPECRACYHRRCYVYDKCPRCERIKTRRLQQRVSLPASPDNSENSENSDNNDDDDDDDVINDVASTEERIRSLTIIENTTTGSTQLPDGNS